MATRAAAMAGEDMGMLSASKLAGPIGIGAGTLAAAVITLAKTPHIIEGFTSGLLEGQRDLRRFNGSIAVAFAQLDRQEYQLAARTGRETSGTTKNLTQSQMALREALQPQRELLTNVKNDLGTFANKAGTSLAETINILLHIRELGEWFKAWAGGQNAAAGQNVLPPFRFMDAVAQGRWTAPRNPLPQGGVNRNPAPPPPGWPQP